MKKKPAKKPKRTVHIIHRKLGREQANGQYLHGATPLIEIDPRLEPKEHLIVSLHEGLHFVFPDLSEKEVDNSSKDLGEIMWAIGYRLTFTGKGTTQAELVLDK